MPRITFPLFAVALVSALAGCGGSNPTPTPPPDPAVSPPPPPADLYELDPARHAPPASPAAGRLNGKPFNPDRIEIQDGRLSFRQGKDFFPDLEVVINLADEKLPAGGGPVVVKPSQKWHETPVTALAVAVRTGDGLPDTKFIDTGYALTLELGKPAGGKVKGKLQLALPGEGKSHLAGTFEAVRLRGANDPLTDADAPFVRGTVTHPGEKGTMLSVGYVELAGQDWVGDRLGMKLPGADELGGRMESSTFRPRVSVLKFDKQAAKFEFTKLPPGSYLLFARLENGPAAWVKAEVKAGDQLTQDMKLEAGKGGAVEVTTPADFTGEVKLAPAELVPADDPNRIGVRVAAQLDLGGKAKDGKVTVADVPPGKYVVFTPAGPLAPRGTVEVAAEKTAAVELEKEKK